MASNSRAVESVEPVWASAGPHPDLPPGGLQPRGGGPPAAVRRLRRRGDGLRRGHPGDLRLRHEGTYRPTDRQTQRETHTQT